MYFIVFLDEKIASAKRCKHTLAIKYDAYSYNGIRISLNWRLFT